MTKLIRSLILVISLLAVITVIIVYWRGNGETPMAESSQSTAPSRMLKMGPVVSGAISNETIGDVTIKMEASRLWIKKSKTFGFDNALFKKIAASDFCLTVSKSGKKLLSASKEQIEMPLDQSIIKINNPEILFPADMRQPDSIRLDKKMMFIFIKIGKYEEIWDLQKM